MANVGGNAVKEITELASKFDDELRNTAFTPRTYATSEQFTLYAVENKQVEATVNSMATHKAPGMEKIPVRVIKDCLPLILPSITSIINTSFATITFPEAGKLVEVTPIIKITIGQFHFCQLCQKCAQEWLITNLPLIKSQRNV